MNARSIHVWPRDGRVAAAIVSICAAAATFLENRHYGLVAFDTLPVILTSRVTSWSDFLGTFSERLMDGRFPGSFYRPLLNLSIAFDYSLWGLDPTGYQLSNALLHGACGFAVFLLVRELCGRSCGAAAWIGMAVYLLHPSAVEVVPAPVRRPDLLCSLFLALALAFQRARRPLTAALCALLAMGAKETAFVTPLLGAAVGFAGRDAGDLASRLRDGARGAALYVAPLGVALAARFAVLGSVGGHVESQTTSPIQNLLPAFTAVLGWLARPQPLMGAGPVAVLLVCAVAGLGAAVCFDRRRAVWGPASRLTVVGGAWLVATSSIYAFVGGLQPWYLAMPLVGWALLFAAAGALVERSFRAGPRRARSVAGLAGAALVALVAWQALYSPWFHAYPHWRRATRASDEFFAALARQIDDTPPGSAVSAPPIPVWVPANDAADRPVVFGAAILADYSVQAWAELVYPERHIRIQTGGSTDAARPGPDEIVIVLQRYAAGFEARPR